MKNFHSKNPWKIPTTNEKIFIEFMNIFSFELSDLTYLICSKNKKYKKKKNDCHNNVDKFLKGRNDKYGKVLGYYLLVNNIDNEILAIQHSVIIDLNTEKLYDITPCIYHKKLFVHNFKLNEYSSVLFKNKVLTTTKTTVYNIDGYFL